jgi:hypothetical protein
MKDTYTDRIKRQSETMLDYHKEKILDLYGKSSYDNYVTGGGTINTDQHYKDEFKKLNDRGIFWLPVYEEIEVDRNIV